MTSDLVTSTTTTSPFSNDTAYFASNSDSEISQNDTFNTPNSVNSSSSQFSEGSSAEENDENGNQAYQKSKQRSGVGVVRSPEPIERIREKNRIAARKHIEKKKRINETHLKTLQYLTEENCELNGKISKIQANIEMLNQLLFSIVTNNK